MTPDEVPILAKTDILEDSEELWNPEQTQATLVGWLKLLFLLPQIEHEVFGSPTATDRKDYHKALGALKEAAGLPKKATEVDVMNWEDKASLLKKAKAFNKAMKGLEYV